MLKHVVHSLVGPSRVEENIRCIMVGGTNCGKTSISFRIAYDIAASGGCPLYICNQAKLESKLPFEVKFADGDDADMLAQKMSPDILARIQLKYVMSMNELKAIIAGLHAFSPSPTTIIIDDLSLLIDPLHAVQRNDPKFLEICFVLAAYIDDALNFLSNSKDATNSAHNSQPLQLVIADSCEDASFLQVLQRTAPTVLNLKRIYSENGVFFSLIALKNGNTKSSDRTAVVFSRIELHGAALLVTK